MNILVQQRLQRRTESLCPDLPRADGGAVPSFPPFSSVDVRRAPSGIHQPHSSTNPMRTPPVFLRRNAFFHECCLRDEYIGDLANPRGNSGNKGRFSFMAPTA